MTIEPKPVTINNREYPSIGKACRDLKICHGLIRYRVNKGMSLEKAFTAPRVYDDKGITIKGCHFPTKVQACEHFGINYNTYHTRINKGMTPEEALTTPVKKN